MSHEVAPLRMMHEPVPVKVSIITPVFNGEAFIELAMKSVMSQTFTDWEWLVIDDGSTDSTPGILRTFLDTRIRALRQENSGVGAARNLGLEHARGEYITFLDADDMLPGNSLASRIAFLDSHPGVDIVNGAVHVVSDGRMLRTYRPDNRVGPLLQRLVRLEEGVFFGVIYMIRRASIGRQRFPTGLTHSEDLLFYLSIAVEGEICYGAVSDTVYEYLSRPGSAMSDLDGLEKGYLELLRFSHAASGIDPSDLKVQRSRVRRILFRTWLRKGRPIRALRCAIAISKYGLRRHNVVHDHGLRGDR